MRREMLKVSLIVAVLIFISSFSFPVDYAAKVYTTKGRIYDFIDLQHEKGEGSFVFHDEEGAKTLYWRDVDYIVFQESVEDYYPERVKDWRDIKGRKYSKVYGPRVKVVYHSGVEREGHLELSGSISGHDELGFRRIHVRRLSKIDFLNNQRWPVPLKERVFTPANLGETLKEEKMSLDPMIADVLEYRAKVYTQRGRIYILKNLQHDLKDGYFNYYNDDGKGKLYWKDIDSIVFIKAHGNYPDDTMELRDIKGRKYSKALGHKAEVTMKDGSVSVLYLAVGDRVYGNDDLGFRKIDSHRISKIEFLKDTGSKSFVRFGN